MDYKLAMMCGTDIPIPECRLIVHQPRIKEIGLLGEQDFFIGAQCLTINSSMYVQDKDLLSNVNNFQIFMTIMQEKETKDKKNSVLSVLQILFPEYKPIFTPRSLLLSKGEKEQALIDETNFEYLQDILRLVFCTKTGSMDQQSFNPANAKAQEIAKKLMRGRERIAAQNNSSSSSVFSQYLSILAVGLGRSLQEMTELTMYQLYDLIERYNLYMAWDIDIRSRLAGGKPENHPDNWMKNIH